MSKKLKEEEGQQSLVNYLSPRSAETNRTIITPKPTVSNSTAVKKRTPPSSEGHCSKKPNMETITETTQILNKALFKEVEQGQGEQMEVQTQENQKGKTKIRSKRNRFLEKQSTV